MDAEYLANTVGQPLSLALAEVCIVQPHDPIEWLSGWLYKYVDSAEYLKEYKKEKWELSTLESQRQQQRARVQKKEEEETGLRISSCNYIASLKDDPFNLWQQAFKAITTFTDCTAVYVAAITEPLWEPKPVKEKKEGEEGEEGEEEEEPPPEESEADEGEEGEEKEGPYDSDEEERIEEEERKAEEAAEAEAAALAAAEAEEKAAAEAAAKEEADAAAAEAGETDAAESEAEEDEEDDKKKKKSKKKKEEEEEEDEDDSKKKKRKSKTEEGVGTPEGEPGAEVLLGPDREPLEPPPPPPPPPKPPRPVKYKKLIARYMAASPSNIFMLNKELNKKTVNIPC